MRAMIDGPAEGAGKGDGADPPLRVRPAPVEEIEPAPRGRNPFPAGGVERDDRGIRRYTDRPPSLVAMLRASTERRDGATAVVELGGRELSYVELWGAAARVAGGLRETGIGRGDRVAIRLPNGIDWVVAFWGVVMSGAVVVPVNMRFADSEVDYVLDDSGAKYCFREGAELPDAAPYVDDELASDDLAAIFYTSGTTGFPKGAVTTHRNFLTNTENLIRMLGIDREEGSELSTLVSVPMFHVTGCNSQLLPLLELGGRVEIMVRGLDLDLILEAVGKHRINLVITVPAIYQALLRHPSFADADLSSARWALYGGAPIATELVRAIQEGFPNARVGNGFGLTETCSMTSFLPHEETEEHVDSVGFAMPSVDLALHQPDPETGVGELLVRGANVVSGYWQRPEANADAFIGPWLRTGDLVRIDDDGLLYIVDRVKDMINRGGENVYSVEVENVVSAAPGVAEAAAIGVPDDMMGEKVGVVVVPLAGREVLAEEVVEYCRGRLADFKVPQYLAVSEDPLPRNPGGKILKKALREDIDWGEPLR